MAIDLNRTFGSKKNSNSEAATEARPKAQFWMNIGYVSEHKDEDGTCRFVSLATGIPLDTQEDLPVNSRNKNFAFFQQARNELRNDLIEECKKLEPGEDVVLEAGPSGLAIQLRRVGDEAAAPTGVNPFARPKS